MVNKLLISCHHILHCSWRSDVITDVLFVHFRFSSAINLTLICNYSSILWRLIKNDSDWTLAIVSKPKTSISSFSSRNCIQSQQWNTRSRWQLNQTEGLTMDDSHVISLIAKLSTSHFRRSSQPPQIDLLQITPSPSFTVTALASCCISYCMQRPRSPTNHLPLHVLWAHLTALSYSKVAIPLLQ